jgi:diguanylate cyclase (GGDEF)-like protein
LWREVAGHSTAFILEPDAPLHVSGKAVRQAMVAPLIGEAGLTGRFVIANRLTEGAPFERDDLRLFETLANQAAVALENGQLERSLTELSRLKEQLNHMAYHDSLTGLANRSLFTDQVEGRLASAALDYLPVVLFLDLDDFKVVNDTMGHAAGDQLLQLVAQRLTGCLRPEDVSARLGGDEFAVLLSDGPDLTAAIAVGSRILDALQAPFLVAGQEMLVGASIGVAAAKRADERADELLRNADVAMYTAKAEGSADRRLRPDDARRDRGPPRDERRPGPAIVRTSSRCTSSRSWISRPTDRRVRGPPALAAPDPRIVAPGEFIRWPRARLDPRHRPLILTESCRRIVSCGIGPSSAGRS